jgi:hypothetical protein
MEGRETVQQFKKALSPHFHSLVDRLRPLFPRRRLDSFSADGHAWNDDVGEGVQELQCERSL